MSRRTAPQKMHTNPIVAPGSRGLRGLRGLRARGLALAAAIVAVAACGGEDPPEGSGGSGGAGGMGGGFFCFPGETEPCYTGPIVSEGVGTCRGGERTCNPEGTAYGVCVGQVTPVPDDCATPEDEDCDGMPAPACAGAVLSSQRFGGTGDDEGRGVAFGPDGSVIAVGSFEGSIDFGGGPLMSVGGKDVFVVKLGPAGEHVFSKAFGGDGDQAASSVAVAGDGSVVVAGSFAGAITFGGGTFISAGGRDVFAVKLSPAGEVAWTKVFGDAGILQDALGVAVDGVGDATVVGAFEGTLDLGMSSLVSSGSTDVFAIKLDGEAGDPVWGARFGDAAKQGARAVAVTASGDVLVGGGFEGDIDAAGNLLVGQGGEDAFLLRLDAMTGAPLLANRFGADKNEAVNAVGVDSSGSAVLAGRFDGPFIAGGVTLQSAGAEDIFVVKVDAAGELVFAKSFGDKSPQIVEAIAVDAAGSIALAGRFSGSLDLGKKPPLPATEAFDIFVGKLSPTGDHVYSYAFGSQFDQVALGVALDKSGNAAVTGWFLGSLQFEGEPLVSAGLKDLFVAKLAP